MPLDTTKQKNRINTMFYTVFCTFPDVIGWCSGGGGGFRTRVQKSSTDSSTYLALSFDLIRLTRTRTLQSDELPKI